MARTLKIEPWLRRPIDRLSDDPRLPSNPKTYAIVQVSPDVYRVVFRTRVVHGNDMADLVVAVQLDGERIDVLPQTLRGMRIDLERKSQVGTVRALLRHSVNLTRPRMYEGITNRHVVGLIKEALRNRPNDSGVSRFAVVVLSEPKKVTPVRRHRRFA